MIATVKIKDLYSVERTERDCHHFYCKCERYDGELNYIIIGLYYTYHNRLPKETRAFVAHFGDNVDAAMDELDRLKQQLADQLIEDTQKGIEDN